MFGLKPPAPHSDSTAMGWSADLEETVLNKLDLMSRRANKRAGRRTRLLEPSSKAFDENLMKAKAGATLFSARSPPGDEDAGQDGHAVAQKTEAAEACLPQQSADLRDGSWLASSHGE